MKFLVRRKTIIKEFAKEIADLQKRADEWFYNKKDKNHSSWLLDQVYELQLFARRLGIEEQVYAEAYKIYDFRNSGKKGFILKDGKIVRNEEVETYRGNEENQEFYSWW